MKARYGWPLERAGALVSSTDTPYEPTTRKMILRIHVLCSRIDPWWQLTSLDVNEGVPCFIPVRHND